MKAPADADRPNLASAAHRGDWKVWLLQEWGLLLLAAVLAILIWEITSSRVVKPRPLRDVQIRLAVDDVLKDRVGAVITGKPTKDFKLICSERERNEAREALDQDGRAVVTIRISEAPPAMRPLNSRLDRYAWPFSNHERILRDGRAEPPEGYVFGLLPADPRVGWDGDDKATRPSRSELDRRGIRVTWTLSQATVPLLAPVGREKLPGYVRLEPDAIDLASVVGKDAGDIETADIPFDHPLSYKLTFNTWRADGDAVDVAWRHDLALPEITATVTLTEITQREVTNALLALLPESVEAKMPADSLPGFDDVGVRLTGTLKGPKAVLDALEADPSGWSWGIHVISQAKLEKVPTGTGAEAPYVKLNAEIVWFATKPEFQNQGVVFLRKPGQDGFDLEVRRRPRAK